MAKLSDNPSIERAIVQKIDNIPGFRISFDNQGAIFIVEKSKGKEGRAFHILPDGQIFALGHGEKSADQPSGSQMIVRSTLKKHPAFVEFRIKDGKLSLPVRIVDETKISDSENHPNCRLHIKKPGQIVNNLGEPLFDLRPRLRLPKSTLDKSGWGWFPREQRKRHTHELARNGVIEPRY